MPNLNVFQPNKQQSTGTQAAPPYRQVDLPPVRPNTLFSSKYKVLDDSFLYPDSDDDGVIEADSDKYELTDDELLDYGRPGRRRAVEKQGLVPASPEDDEKAKWLGSLSSEVSKTKENENAKRTKEMADGLQVNEVKVALKDKTNVTHRKTGFLSGLKR